MSALRSHPQAPPSPERRARRVGWVVVGIGVGLLGLVGAYLSVVTASSPMSSAGDGLVFLAISPALAAGTALATGLLLAVLAALRLIGISVGRALSSMTLGFIAAPVLWFLGSFLVFADNPSIWVGAAYVTMIPIVLGVGTVLVTAVL